MKPPSAFQTAGRISSVNFKPANSVWFPAHWDCGRTGPRVGVEQDRSCTSPGTKPRWARPPSARRRALAGAARQGQAQRRNPFLDIPLDVKDTGNLNWSVRPLHFIFYCHRLLLMCPTALNPAHLLEINLINITLQTVLLSSLKRSKLRFNVSVYA